MQTVARSGALDIIQELTKHYCDARRVDVGGEAYRLERRTPAHNFLTLLIPLPGSLHYAAITSRDFFDEVLAHRLFEFVQKNMTQVDISRAGVILEGFHAQGYGFDSVLVLGPSAHETLKVESPTVHASTLEVMPIYRCEFSGREDGELIELIRGRFVATIDWKRKASPQVWMKYKNLRTQARSRGKKLGLTTLDVLLREIKELPGSAGSFIEVKNFKDEPCKLTSEGMMALIESPLLPAPIRAPFQAPLGSWMEAFATGGIQRFKEALPQ